MTDTSAISAALQRGGVIDITTTGAKTGQPRRLEIVMFPIDGRLYISGRPGTRGWIANLKADPRMTIHLKSGISAALAATARVITEPEERRPIIERITQAWDRQDRFEVFLARAPLIEVTLDDASLMRLSADAA